jgi:hypothetical protein
MTSQQQRTERLFNRVWFCNNNLINNLASAITKTQPIAIPFIPLSSFFWSHQLQLQRKILLNFTGRRDGSSRFGPGKQYANFGAIGAAWIF